ncbi:TolC family protein [Sphingobacterium sp. LRF_L2]|uniref:TolC family protein n=1 Tax=Sphingobacterium sp. LRF_L2 TaxID=3369421 RepID=UPI003F5D9478
MKKIIIVLMFICYQTLHAQNKVWSLNDCIQYALENNISVKSAALDISTAELNYKQARYNKTLPTVSGSGSVNAANGSSINAITSEFVNQFQLTNSYGVTAALSLYEGGRLNLEIQKNALLVKQSELYKSEAVNNIQLSVIEGYLQSLYYFEGISIAKNLLASSKEELEQGRVKFNNGALARKDLADLETQYAANQYAVVSAENQYAQQVLTLKQLLEIDPQEEFVIQNNPLSEDIVEIPRKDQVFQNALATLPTVKIYDLQADILKKELDITKAAYKPSLSLNGGLNSGYTNSLSSSYWTQVRGNFSQNIGLSLSVPIFSKKQNKTNISLAKINIQQNELDKLSASKSLYAKIETVWQNAVSNQAQEVSAKIARDNAKLAYELSRKKYDFGGLTTTELTVSRNTYLSAEQTYLQARYLSELYLSLLNFYQGTAEKA